MYAAFKSSLERHTVLGLAHSRSTDELQKLDLLDYEATQRVFSEFKPDCESHGTDDRGLTLTAACVGEGVIHCAAERRPDVAEKVRTSRVFLTLCSDGSSLQDPEGTHKVYISHYSFDT